MFGFEIPTILSGLAGAAGVAVGWWKARNLKTLVVEVFDLVRKYREYRRDGLSVEEIDKLIDEFEDVARAAAKVWRPAP